MKNPRIFFLLLIVIPSISYGSGTEFRPIKVVEGSSLLSVRSICQDDQGMIWFGTDMNLYKYDGYECIKCLDSQDNANGRLFINCLECFGDSIILGCVDGIAFYDRLNESFTPILYLKDVEVYSLLKDDDCIWIGAQSGLYRYSFDSGTFSAVAGNLSSDSEWIRSMAFSGNYIYIGTTAHLARYGLLSGIYEQLHISGLPSNIEGIDAIVPQPGGHLFVGTSDGLFDVDLHSNTSHLLASYEWVKTMKESGDRMVLGTDAGLFLYDKRDGSNNMISGNVVWSIMNDSAGNCWYGSDTGLLMSRKEIIRQVPGLPEDALNCYSNISGDNKGRIFAGGTHGLVISSTDGSCVWYRLGDSIYNLSHNKVRSIAHDPVADDIYILLPTGLSLFNDITNEFEGKRFNYFTSFYDGYGMVADTSEMWVAALSGVYKVENMKTVRQYTNADGLSSSRAVQVEKTTDGRIWVRTTDRSIFLFDRECDAFVPFVDPVSGNNMKGDLMMADSKGNIWITHGAEVCRVCLEDGRWKSELYDFGKATSFEIKSMVEVDNDIWICLPNEITIVNQEGSIGRLSMECDYAGMYYDKFGGRVLLGATDRIDEITPNDVRAILHRMSAPIHVTGMVVNEETVLPYSVIKTGQVTLSHRENSIRLYFSDFDYSIGNMRKFMFNLDGRENQWIETQGNSIMLPDLPPGRHRIFISSSGSELANNSVFTVKILRPWYSSWWALALYSFIFMSITFLIAKNTILRNKLEMERVQKQRLLAQAATKMNFFTEVAHEFKTPLSLIIAPIGKLLQETEDQGRRNTLQLMHNNAMKLNSLIRLSLDYYNDRSEPGEEVILLNVEFVEFAKSIFNSFKESWPDHTFIFNSSSPSIEAITDVIKMETILNNLLSNACKYTPADGTVILALEENADKGTLQISVSDTGIGIPDEELPFIYQRYFQSSRSKKQRKDGSGVGLTIVRKYVEQLKGEITVSSDDNGTTFRLSFPVRTDLPDNAGEHEVVLTKENKPLVVIVDDNRSICDFLTDALSPEFQCVCAFDGNSGLKLCKSVSPDLIISDVVMPIMDGLEMCRQIRNNNSLSTVPIILLTARGDHDTELKSIDLNIDMFIPKPFDMQTLYSRVKQLADRRKILEKKVRIDMIAEPKAEIGQSVDEKYLLKVTSLIENHIDDPELSVTKLCELGGFSEKQLYRKIKSLTGMTTVEYIRSIRMKKAAMLLQSCKFTVSEAMYMVGFSNTSYFARTFSEMYGKSPSEYQQLFRE